MIFNRSLISSSASKKYLRHYAKQDNWHELDPKTGNLGYGWLHYALIRILRPKRVLVIGSRYGFIPACCALACKDNQKGIVDFVDAGYDQSHSDNPNHWGGKGFWWQTNVQDHFNQYHLNQYIKTHITTSQAFHQRNAKRKWQYVNLDGDHSYRGLKQDFHRFWPQLDQPGFISLHDIFTTKSVDNLPYGVYRFWRELKQKNKFNLLEIPGKFGLGVIQK